jgi:hypothetical protein
MRLPGSNNLYYVYAMPGHRSPESARPPPKAWGVGRVAFFARIDAIRTELAEGWPLTAVYARHKGALGIGYSGFCRLVALHAADARPLPSGAINNGVKRVRRVPAHVTGPDPVPDPRESSPTEPSFEGSRAHDGHRSPGTFHHDPIERPGDYERLFGARKR